MQTHRWLLAAALTWMVIIATMWGFETWPYWWTLIPALFVIGGRQHGLSVLMHEGVHYRVSESRWWNDGLADWLAGYFILAPTAGYRPFHLKHHRLLDTPDDPERITVDRFSREWTFPMPMTRLLFYLVRDLTGLWPKPVLALMGVVWTSLGPERWRHGLNILILHGAVAYGSWVTGHFVTYLLLWWLPLFTVFPLCFRLRTAAEHSAVVRDTPRYSRPEVNVLATTRTVIAQVPGRLLFGPHNIRLHIEHHLYPSVPFHRLPELRTVLSASPEYAATNRSCRGYGEAVRELTRIRDG